MTAILRILFWLVGSGLLVYGVYLYEPRAAFLAAGVLLLIEANDGQKTVKDAAPNP